MKREIRPIDFLLSWATSDQYLGFLVGDAIKYVSRYQHGAPLSEASSAEEQLSRAMVLAKKHLETLVMLHAAVASVMNNASPEQLQLLLQATVAGAEELDDTVMRVQSGI